MQPYMTTTLIVLINCCYCIWALSIRHCDPFIDLDLHTCRVAFSTGPPNFPDLEKSAVLTPRELANLAGTSKNRRERGN